MSKEKNLIWIDLEMTGLNPQQDTILEIASVITDSDLNIVAKGPSLVVHQPNDVLDRMAEWSKEQHQKSGLLDEVKRSTVTVQQAAEQTLSFLKDHCVAQASPLCGNSVWTDRIFLRAYMPQVDAFTHYRIIDVTSIKELALRWYPETPEYEKKDAHRGMEDILESIDELKFYRQKFFV